MYYTIAKYCDIPRQQIAKIFTKKTAPLPSSHETPFFQNIPGVPFNVKKALYQRFQVFS